jgi:hypothetical protein
MHENFSNISDLYPLLDLLGSIGFLSLLKLGLTPSKKTSKMGWKPSITTKTFSNDRSFEPSSYAEAVARNDGESLPPTISPSSSFSPQSSLGFTNLPGWAKATEAEAETTGVGGQDVSPIPSSSSSSSSLFLPPPPSSLSSSPVATITPRRSLFRRQPSHSSLAEIMTSPCYLDRSQYNDQDISIQHDISPCDISQDISYDHYDFDLNHHYDFDLDDDLATERHRYLISKNAHIDGVEITAVEGEFTKSFNRIKLDRRPRRKNRRKPKYPFAVSGKREEILKVIDDFENLRL